MNDDGWLVARFEDGIVVFDGTSGDTHWLDRAHEAWLLGQLPSNHVLLDHDSSQS